VGEFLEYGNLKIEEFFCDVETSFREKRFFKEKSFISENQFARQPKTCILTFEKK
jgi:hypothetical protein